MKAGFSCLKVIKHLFSTCPFMTCPWVSEGDGRRNPCPFFLAFTTLCWLGGSLSSSCFGDVTARPSRAALRPVQGLQRAVTTGWQQNPSLGESPSLVFLVLLGSRTHQGLPVQSPTRGSKGSAIMEGKIFFFLRGNFASLLKNNP